MQMSQIWSFKTASSSNEIIWQEILSLTMKEKKALKNFSTDALQVKWQKELYSQYFTKMFQNLYFFNSHKACGRGCGINSFTDSQKIL